VALAAIAFDAEGIFAVMAEPAGFTCLHVGHGLLLRTGFEREGLGVAVGAFIHAGVDIVAEFCFAGFGLECYVARFETVVALVAAACDREGVLAVVTSSARLALLHITHACMNGTGLEREGLGVAIVAAVHACMHCVTESSIGYSLHDEGDVFRFQPLVAVAAVAGNGEGFFAIVTCAAGLPFFHLGHGDRFA